MIHAHCHGCTHPDSTPCEGVTVPNKKSAVEQFLAHRRFYSLMNYHLAHHTENSWTAVFHKSASVTSKRCGYSAESACAAALEAMEEFP